MSFYSNLVSTIRSPLTSLLSFSVRFNSSYGARFALFLGADVHAVDEQQNGFLHRARSAAVASTLLGFGIALEGKNALGETPLFAIIKNGAATATTSLSLVNYLIDKGADVNARDNKLATPLHYARAHAVLDALFGSHRTTNNANVNAQDVDLDTPMHLAVRSGDQVRARILSDKRVDVSLANRSGKTPVTELSDIITATPADSRAAMAEKFRHLAFSVLGRFLTNSPAARSPFCAADNFTTPGFSLLNYIAMNCNPAAISLLATRENVDQQNGLGKTSLMYATGTSNLEAVKALRSLGADPRVMDAANKTAAAYVVETGPNAAAIKDALQPTMYEKISQSALAQRAATELAGIGHQATTKLQDTKTSMTNSYNAATDNQKQFFEAIVLAAAVGSAYKAAKTITKHISNALKA